MTDENLIKNGDFADDSGWTVCKLRKNPMTDRSTILELVNEYITKDRAATHGGAEDSFKTIAAFWSEYLGTSIERHDVCAMMALLKVARIKGNPNHLDSWVDVAGYAALGGEITSDENGFTDLVRNGGRQ